jgi:hypothetical protein
LAWIAAVTPALVSPYTRMSQRAGCPPAATFAQQVSVNAKNALALFKTASLN